MDLMQFVPEQLMGLIAALYVIGMIMKATTWIPDWYIPWMLMFLGVFGSVELIGPTATAVVQGIISAGVCVFTNQLIKQTTKK